MLEALALLLGAAGLIRLAPDLPISRWLDGWLAQRPVRWIERRTREELIAWTIMAALVAFAGQYVLVIGGPHAALGLAVELAAYVDALIGVATLAAAARMQTAARWLKLRARKVGRRPRSVRARRAARLLRPSNDNGERPARLAA